jgi:hypothetical protein
MVSLAPMDAHLRCRSSVHSLDGSSRVAQDTPAHSLPALVILRLAEATASLFYIQNKPVFDCKFIHQTVVALVCLWLLQDAQKHCINGRTTLQSY